MGEVEGVASTWGGGVGGTSVGGALTSARPAASAGESGATDIRQSITWTVYVQYHAHQSKRPWAPEIHRPKNGYGHLQGEAICTIMHIHTNHRII